MTTTYAPPLNGQTSTTPTSATFETVSPAQASAWLKRGGRNRKISQARVDIFTAAIQRGEWRLTGEAVKLDGEGRVRDGQHRLLAVVKSGIPIDTLIIRGVPDDAFDVMDTGRVRSVGDMIGYHGYANANVMGGAVRLLILHERSGRFIPPGPLEKYVSGPATLKYLEQHPDVENGVRLSQQIRTGGIAGGGSIWAAVMTLFLRADPEKAYQYAHYVATGADLTSNHPLLLLRNRFAYRRGSLKNQRAVTSDRELVAALAIKAWNAFIAGRDLKQLHWKGDGGEDFPTVARP